MVVAVLCGARDVVTVCPAFLVLSLRDDGGLGERDMGKSIGCLFVHLVFATKLRERLIDREVRFLFHSKVVEILDEMQCETLAVNSVEDHVHVLLQISRDLSVAQLAKDLKRLTSRWMKTQGERLREFSWQVGYGAFSVSMSQVTKVKRYIALQESHHQLVDFAEEFTGLLKAHGVECDGDWIWD